MSSYSVSFPLLACLWVAASAATTAYEDLFDYDETSALQQSREAYRQGRYDASMRFALDVILKNPSHPQARELLRLSGRTAAAMETSRIQAERRDIKQQAEDRRKQARLWEIPQNRWNRDLEAFLDKDDLLGAYDFLYAIQEQNPDNSWVEERLEGRMSRMVTWKQSAFTWRPTWYQDVVWGYFYYSQKDWGQAKKRWRSALASAGKNMMPSEKRIRRYLKQIQGRSKEAPGR